MPVWTGFFKGKKPSIRFQLAGTQGHPQEVTATVDTGFDGFFLISADEAQPHGLESVGTSMATMANGSRAPVELSRAKIGFAGATRAGIASVFPSKCECLVGMDFLRVFDLALILTPTKLLLATLDEIAILG